MAAKAIDEVVYCIEFFSLVGIGCGGTISRARRLQQRRALN
jgi:hypothetical protein